MKKITIKGDFITLTKLLKYEGIITTGGSIIEFLDNDKIFVNNNLVTEKRKKIYVGDILEIKEIGVFEIIN